jgi:hypothetical protein
MSDRIKIWLLAVLFASNVGLGAVGLYALRSLDANYSELLARGLPSLENLRTLTRDMSSAQRASLRAMSAVTAAEREEHLAALLNILSAIEASRADLVDGPSLLNSEDIQRIDAAARRYRSTVEIMLKARQSGAHEDAARLHREEMRPAYELTIAAIDVAASRVVKNGFDLRARYSSDSTRYTRAIAFLGGWPVAIGAVVLLVAAALAAFLLLAYRSMGSTEHPS